MDSPVAALALCHHSTMSVLFTGLLPLKFGLKDALSRLHHPHLHQPLMLGGQGFASGYKISSETLAYV